MTSLIKRLNDRYDGNIYFKVYPPEKDTGKGRYRLQLSAQPSKKANQLPIGGRYSMVCSKRTFLNKGGQKDMLLRLLLQHFQALKPDLQVFGIPLKDVL